jgi:hypothetical protein
MAKTITVDIRTRFIPDNQRCYILFPGDGYRYYGAMRDQGAVFLDTPGLELPVSDNPKTSVKQIVLSSRIGDWHRAGRPSDKMPPRNLEEVKYFRNTPGQQHFAGLVRGFFNTIRSGDIVIVPPQGYDDDVLFGEIGPRIKNVSVRQYPKEAIPGRAVRWIGRVPRSKIPLWLERKIPSPNPLRQIEKEFFPDIFDIMYERYFYQDEYVCKFDVKSKEFSSLDNFLFQQIVLYAAALHEGRHEGNISDIAATPISLVVSKLEFSQDIPDQRIQINSPGHIVVYSKNIIPLVAGIFMSMSAMAGDAGHSAAVVIENSADTSQVSKECVADIKQEVMEDMIAMGYKRWQELCTIEAQARKRTQISSGIEATPSGTASKQDRLTK